MKSLERRDEPYYKWMHYNDIIMLSRLLSTGLISELSETLVVVCCFRN